MTKRSIIPQRRKSHLPTIAMDAMEENGAPRKTRAPELRREDHEDHAFCRRPALSLGIGSAYAAQGPADGYVYPDYIAPGSVYAGAPTSAQTTPATAQNGRAVHTYVTHSQSQGIWLFPPNQTGGGSN